MLLNRVFDAKILPLGNIVFMLVIKQNKELELYGETVNFMICYPGCIVIITDDQGPLATQLYILSAILERSKHH
jgi:hypothetical protein